jgi:hypothetical protein
VPLEEAPAVIWAHETLDIAVQGQPEAAITPTELGPPPEGIFADGDCRVYEQLNPFWFTVNDWPATVSTALRAALPGLAATVKFTVEEPVPLVADSVSQETLDDAIHEQLPEDAVMVTDPPPPDAAWVGLLAEIEKPQGAPASEIGAGDMGCPPIRICAVRVAVLELGSMEKDTLPLPKPKAWLPELLVILDTWIQDGPGSTVQVQPANVVTPTTKGPPDDGSDEGPLNPKVQPRPAWFTASVWPAIVAESDRLVPAGFAAMFSVTVPEPVPEAAPLIDRNEPPGVVAVHGQPEADALIVMGPLVAPDPTVSDDGEMVNAQVEPNCVTVYVSPCTVTEPVRCAGFGLRATVKETDPGPVPLGVFTVIHESAVVAVQLQPAVVFTAKPKAPPAASADAEAGFKAKPHTAAAVTVSVTGTTSGELEVEDAVIVIAPL